MSLSVIDWYLIGANALGFILYGINMALYKHTANGHIDTPITVVSLLGGSLGILLFIILFDRKSVKENMMSRVFLVSVLGIQIVAYLFLIGKHSEQINFAFWRFFSAHKWMVAYLIIINVVAIIAFGIDKIRALEHKWRIPILMLLGIAFAGGSVGSLIGMYAFRHKTNQDYFTVGVPLILAMHIVVLFYLMNIG